MTDPNQCPRCGSDDPDKRLLQKLYENGPAIRVKPCSDPWHTPAPQPALRPPNEPLVPVNDSYDDNARMAAPQAPTYCQICGGIGAINVVVQTILLLYGQMAV